MLLYCSHSLFDFTWRSLLHNHPHAELFYCTGGRGHLQIADQKLPLKRGDLFIITPQVLHTEYSSLDEPLEYIVLGLDQISFSAPLGEAPRFFLLHSDSDTAQDMGIYFWDILRESQALAAGYLSVCKHLLDILLVKIGRQLQVDIRQPVNQTSMKECSLAKKLMDARFQEHITLDGLAQEVNLSKYYLSRSFRRCYGLPPMQYLSQRRLLESMYLLLNTDHSTAKISKLAGFSSPSYFSQAFREAMGMSPQQYRKARPAILVAQEKQE